MDGYASIRSAACGARDVPPEGHHRIILLTLALAIGANTAVFSAVHAVLLEPLPYADPEPGDGLREAPGRRRVYESGLAGRLSRLGAAQSSFAAMAAFSESAADLTGSGEPERLTMAGVTGGLLRRLWGPGPSWAARFSQARTPLGRQSRGRARACALAATLWRRSLGGRPPHRAQRPPVRSDRRLAAGRGVPTGRRADLRAAGADRAGTRRHARRTSCRSMRG